MATGLAAISRARATYGGEGEAKFSQGSPELHFRRASGALRAEVYVNWFYAQATLLDDVVITGLVCLSTRL